MDRVKVKRTDLLADSARVPLLSVDRLRVRAGGRVIVDGLEFDIDEGGMMALVGLPISAMSVVLDCITGSRSPSRGSVRFRGRRLERAFTPRVAWRIAGIGLAAGLAVAAAAVDADRLWSAVVSRGIAVGEPVTPGSIGRRLRSYFRAELAIDRVSIAPATEEWLVVTADGCDILARCRSRTEAVAIRNALQAAVTARRAGPGTVPDVTDMATVEEGTPRLPEQLLDRLAAGKRLIRQRGWTGLAVGWLVGVVLAAADWRRGRQGSEVSARAGVSRVFQDGRPFPGLTVLENLLVAGERAGGSDGGRQPPLTVRERASAELAFVGLADDADRLAGHLPPNRRIRLAIARAIMSDAVLVLLDEPSSGCQGDEFVELAELIRRMRHRGFAVLLAEQSPGPLVRLADRVVTIG